MRKELVRGRLRYDASRLCASRLDSMIDRPKSGLSSLNFT